MKTKIDEVGDQIYRICTELPPEAVPGGFTFNQYLVVDDEPLLFHTGPKPFFAAVREAIEKVIPVSKLKHIAFSHWEQDESGSLDEFLLAAPRSTAVCSQVGAMINGTGMARPPRAMADGATFRTGKKTMRWIEAPHLPHGWDCGYLFEEHTKTLFCGDLFTQPGAGMKALTESDILGPSEVMRQGMDYFAHGPNTRPLLDKVAATHPTLLACMHGSAWRGNGAGLIRELSGVLGG